MSAQLDNDDELFPAPPEPRGPTAFQRFCKRIGLRISRWIVEHCEVINMTFIEAIVLEYLDASDIGRRIATQQMAIEATDIAQAELDRLVRRSFKSVRAEQSNLQALTAKQRDEIAQLRGRLNAQTEMLRSKDGAKSAAERLYPSKPTPPHSIGPFTFDEAAETTTLAPGHYHLEKPVTLGLTRRTVIEGVSYGGTAVPSLVGACMVCGAQVVRQRVTYGSETALFDWDAERNRSGSLHENTCKGFAPKVQE